MDRVGGPVDGGLDELLAALTELLQDLAPLLNRVQQRDLPLHPPNVHLLQDNRGICMYRAEKKSLQNIFKQDPGRARQSS